MKKWVLIALSFFFFSFGGKVVYGQESHLFEISLKTYLLEYEEDFGSYKETEKGFMFPGAHVSYTFVGKGENLFMGRLLAEWADSETTYQNLLNQKGVSSNQFFSFEGNLGLGLFATEIPKATGYPFEGLQATFMYFGVGYGQWQREIGNTLGIGGYKGNYKHLYFPLGLKGFYYISGRWFGSFDFALAVLYPQEADLKLSQRSINFVNAKAKYDKFGMFLKFELTLDYQLIRHFYLTFSLQYRFVFIGESEGFTFSTLGNQSAYPENSAHEFGLRLGLRLSF